MAKSTTFLLTLCLVAMMASVIMATGVALKFADEKIISGVPTNLEITFTNVAFGTSSALPVSLTGLSDYVTLKNHNNFANGISSVQKSCIDSTTKQIVGTLTDDSGYKFSMSSNVIAARATAFPEDKSSAVQSSLTILCPVFVSTLPEVTEVTLENLSFYVVAGTATAPALETVEDNLKATLTFPTAFTHPVVDLKSVSLSQPKRVTSSGKLSIEFTTDTAGQFSLELENGLSIITYSFEKFEHSAFFCTAGSNKQAARIITNGNTWVLVDTPSEKTAIKCEFFVTFSSNFVRSERLLARLTLGSFITTRSISYSMPAGYASALFSANAANGEYTIGTSLRALSSSSTPLNVNSTVVFKFGSQIDVSTLKLSSSQQDYRGFSCGLTKGTISVKGNEILLKDISFSSDSLDCTFTLIGDSAFNYLRDNKMSSAEIFIDGKALDSHYSTGTKLPLYLASANSIFNIDNEMQSEFKDGVYSVVQTFSISDNYSDVHVTPNDPVILISYPQGNFKNEDLASQFTCEHTTPTHSKFVPLELKLEPHFGVFTHHLKDIRGVESYSIKVQCKYSVNQIMAYGIDVTPNQGLSLTMIDLIDKHRFSTRPSASQKTFPLVSTPTDEPSGVQLPAPVALNFAATVPVLLPTDNVFAQVAADVKAVANAPITTAFGLAEITSGTKVNADYTISNVLTPSLNTQINGDYINAPAQAASFSYYYETLKNHFIGYSVNVPSPYQGKTSFSGPTGYAGSAISTTTVVEQRFTVSRNSGSTATTVTPTALINALNSHVPKAIYDTSATKVVGAQTFIPLSMTADMDEMSTGLYNPITACGRTSGAIATPQTTVAVGAAYTWGSYEITDFILCSENDTCAVNADCGGGAVCEGAKCVEKTKKLAPFVPYQIYSNALFKEFYNDVATVSYAAAVAAVVLAIIF